MDYDFDYKKEAIRVQLHGFYIKYHGVSHHFYVNVLASGSFVTALRGNDGQTNKRAWQSDFFFLFISFFSIEEAIACGLVWR